jgi:hypothetical protein
MLISMTISPLSPRAHHGAVCSEHGMSRAFCLAGQICAFVCPSPQSSLTTGPRFVETQAMTTLGGYVTGKRGQVWVVPKLSRVIALCKTLLPREKILPTDRDEHLPREFGRCPPQSKGGDGRMYQAGVIPPFSKQTAIFLVEKTLPCA